MNPELDKIYRIVDEGCHTSVTKQLENCFGKSGKVAIYFRAAYRPEEMLASTEPITDELYAAWLDAEEDGEA